MNKLGIVIIIVVFSFILLLYLLPIIRLTKDNFAPTKTVKAQVINKHYLESFSKYSRTGTHYTYVVTFYAEGKSLSFYVSAASYDGYKINEKGTLTYKGRSLLDFQ